MAVDWNDPVFLLFAHLFAVAGVETIGGLFVFRPAVDGLRLRLTRRPPNTNWRLIIVMAFVTTLLAVAYYLWMPGELELLVEDIDGAISRIGLPSFVLFLMAVVILGYWGLIFGFLNPVLRAVFDAVYYPCRWGIIRLSQPRPNTDPQINRTRISERKNILSGVLTMFLGVLPALVFLRPLMGDGKDAITGELSPHREELELFLGLTKNEIIRISETMVLGLFVFAFFVAIAVPFARHVLASIPSPGFERREIRRVGYWIMIAWLVALVLHASKMPELAIPAVIVAVLLLLARPAIELLKSTIEGHRRADTLLRVGLLVMFLALLFGGFWKLGLLHHIAEHLDEASVDPGGRPTILDIIIHVSLTDGALGGLLPLVLIIAVINPLARLAVDIFAGEARRRTVRWSDEEFDEVSISPETRTRRRRAAVATMILLLGVLPAAYLVTESPRVWVFPPPGATVEASGTESQESVEPSAKTKGADNTGTRVWGLSKVEFIQRAEALIATFVLAALILTFALPLSRYVMVSVPGADFTRREIRQTQTSVAVLCLGAATIAVAIVLIGSF